jgi:Flp pilus assembly protein TadG
MTFRKSESGQTLVEAAIYISVFILIVMGITDLTFYMLGAMMIQESATEGANFGSAPGNQSNTAGMVEWAEQAATGVNLTSTPVATRFYTCTPGGAQVSSSSSCSSGNAPMEYVNVTTTGTINPLFRISGLTALNVTGSSTYRVAWNTQ